MLQNCQAMLVLLVYMEMIKHVVDSGKQAIMLIPEIGLTYQTVKRFKKYFGNRVAIMNSTPLSLDNLTTLTAITELVNRTNPSN